MSLIPALCAHFKPRSVLPALLALFTASAAVTQPSTPPTSAATPGAIVIFALPEELKAPPGRPEGADTLARLRYFLDARFLDRFVDSPTGKLAFVKYSEYRKLLARKKEIEDRLARQARQTPPVDALVGKASYAVRIEENQAFVTARFDVAMLAQTGWKLLPLVGGKIAVSGFASPITGAHLVVREMLARPIGRIEPRESTFSILTDAQGAGEVVLDFAVGVLDDGPGRQVSFQVPRVPLSSVDLTLDQRDCIVRVEPAVRVTEAPTNPLRVTAQLKSSDRLTIAWAPRHRAPETPAAAKEPARSQPRLVVDRAMTLFTIAQEQVHVRTVLDVEVSRAPVSSIRLRIGEGTLITGVDEEGPTRVLDEKARESLVTSRGEVVEVPFRSPHEGTLRLVLDTRLRLDRMRSEIDLAPIWVEGADRIREGYAAIASQIPIDLHATAAAGEKTILRTQLPEEFGQATFPILHAFRYERSGASLHLKLDRPEPLPHSGVPF